MTGCLTCRPLRAPEPDGVEAWLIEATRRRAAGWEQARCPTCGELYFPEAARPKDGRPKEIPQ